MNVEKVMTSGRNKNIVSSSAVALRLDAKQPITSIDAKKEYSYVCIWHTICMHEVACSSLCMYICNTYVHRGMYISVDRHTNTWSYRLFCCSLGAEHYFLRNSIFRSLLAPTSSPWASHQPSTWGLPYADSQYRFPTWIHRFPLIHSASLAVWWRVGWSPRHFLELEIVFSMSFPDEGDTYKWARRIKIPNTLILILLDSIPPEHRSHVSRYLAWTG